jgi:hypothetical protein
MIEIKPGEVKGQSLIQGNISHVHMLLNDVVNELKNTIHNVVVHNKTKTCQVRLSVNNGTMFIEVTNYEEDEKFRFDRPQENREFPATEANPPEEHL